MGTRRPMNRTSSGNGRYYDSLGSSNGSASESEDNNGSSYNARADSRNYLLNVRPENSRSSSSRYPRYTPGRTTFCSIISQLTEETQPCFETTLKPRAVSEGSDAKFICMVSGYPEPEITWYKDDEEMDRYCGLPKYEIFRNGKRHTLQIYKCSEEDAAIYQASARNNKGIVSCSGVLEVGTMTEYKIHQRWFAKLKRKAEAKMREIEQSRRKVKENLDEAERLRALSPERIQRKRRFSGESKENVSPSSLDKEDVIKVHIPDPNSRLQEEVNTMEQPVTITNGFPGGDKSQGEEITTNGYALPEKIEENGKEFLAYVYETVEVITKKPTSKESYAKKKKKEEPPSIPVVEPRREEAAQGSSPKKGEGISPAPRRSRSFKDTAKVQLEEKMDVQPAPTSLNRRFAPSTVLPKMGKTMAVNDSKKKDVAVPVSRTGDSLSSEQCQLHPKEEVNFSLRDMYFGDSLPVPEEEKIHEREKKTQVSNVGKHIVPPSAKPTLQGQVKETPKAAPRRSREQRELSAGRKSQASSTSVKPSVPGAETNLEKEAVKPVDNMQYPLTAEKSTELSEPPNKPLPCDILEENVKKMNLPESVPFSSLSPEPTTLKEAITSNQGCDEKKKHETEDSSINRTASEDPFEDKPRAETLQKLHNLEVEYMALQKAYALLQHQLELSKQAEEKEIKLRENTEPTGTSEQKDSREPLDDKNNLSHCSSSPVPVYMETDEPDKEDIVYVVDNVNQSQQERARENTGSEKSPSLRSQHSPVSFMDCSSVEGSYIKDNQVIEMEEINLTNKDALQTKADSRMSKEVEVTVSQADGKVVKLIESSQSSEKKCSSVVAEISNEVEMSEDVKEAKWTAELKELTSVSSQRSEQPQQTPLGSTHEISSTVILIADPVITHSSEMLSSVPSQLDDLELNVTEKVLDAEPAGATSTEILTRSDPNQSVVTLLRDVKKALESGITNDVELPSDSSSSSAVSPPVISTPEGFFDVESMLPLSPEGEKSVSQDPVILEVEDNHPESSESLLKNTLSTEVLEVSSLPERCYSKTAHDENKLKEQTKQDHSLVTSLKNSLLMLLHMKTADTVESTPDATNRTRMGVAQTDSSGEMSSPEGSMSPPNSRKICKTTKDSDTTESPDGMHSASTSGKLTPTSEEDMSQNVEPIQTSPMFLRKMIESSKKGIIPQVESAPISPVAPRRSAKHIPEEIFLSKEALRFSPSTSRKIAAKIAGDTDCTSSLSVPSIVVGGLPFDKPLGNVLNLYPDSNRKSRSTENLSSIPSATPEELASGARRKIYPPKQLDDTETGSIDSLTPPSKKESPNVSPGLSRRNNTLLASQSPSAEKRSPHTSRRMAMLEVPKIYEESGEKEKTADDNAQQQYKDKEDIPAVETKKINDPYKAPQVIRKIRAEQFSDASGNLKLWCQFFNILSDSVITWHKDEVQVAKVNRCSGDEGQVSLAIVQASTKDCGVYQCSIDNVYGTDSTDCLLSAEILSGFISKEETEVGEEIEMTPMVFAKGLADAGYWGDKYFGRIVMEDAHVGEGFLRKSCRVKVIYGLEPMFESGKTCIIKIKNLITFGTKNESTLVEKNYEITIQECKIQNTTREYCKIFAAECRVVPNFGQVPEILPLNLIYRPANNIPYATIEEDLEGRFEKYCIRDLSGKLHMKNTSEIEQKCCTFQHWVYLWTSGNFLVTTLEGVGWKLTNIGIATKSKGYQGLKESCCPAVLDEFPLVHQCNSYCEMLALKSLKVTEGLQPPPKQKGSKSPSTGRKAVSAQSSPQIQKKGLASPQSARKGGVSPKATRKVTEATDNQSAGKNKSDDVSKSAKSQ
ncbi:alpha-protein kinase 3 [Discoglossus pictus]